MMKIIVNDLDIKKVEEIKTAISTTEATRKGAKELSLVLNNTKGDYKLALEIVKLVNRSNVDLLVDVSGTNDASGTLLAVAGKQGERRASSDAIFVPFVAESNTRRSERLSPQNQSILSTLKDFQAHGRGLKTVFSGSQALSAFEAKSLRIVDKVDRIQSKYKESKPKRNRHTYKRSS